MAVRRRILPSGATRWLADYRDDTGKRRFRQFSTKHEATCFHGAATARGPAFEPNPTYYRPLRFTAKVPANGARNDAGRELVVAAFCAEHPHYQPSAGSIVLHIDAVMSPASTMADVDNLLKPVLDALKGHAWIDDTQICELLVRRVLGRGRQWHIKFWNVPTSVLPMHALDAA